MNAMIICVGKLKERYWREAAAEYGKRLSRYGKLETVELPDLPEPLKPSPAEEQKIKAVIDHVLQKLENEKTLWIRTDAGEIRLRLAEILFIESQNQNVLINTASDSYSVRGNMSDYEERLTPEGFFRIHRSYLAALSKIQRINGKEAVMEDGTVLPVSRSKEARLREALFSFVSREAF